MARHATPPVPTVGRTRRLTDCRRPDRSPLRGALRWFLYRECIVVSSIARQQRNHPNGYHGYHSAEPQEVRGLVWVKRRLPHDPHGYHERSRGEFGLHLDSTEAPFRSPMALGGAQKSMKVGTLEM